MVLDACIDNEVPPAAGSTAIPGSTPFAF